MKRANKNVALWVVGVILLLILLFVGMRSMHEGFKVSDFFQKDKYGIISYEQEIAQLPDMQKQCDKEYGKGKTRRAVNMMGPQSWSQGFNTYQFGACVPVKDISYGAKDPNTTIFFNPQTNKFSGMCRPGYEPSQNGTGKCVKYP